MLDAGDADLPGLEIEPGRRIAIDAHEGLIGRLAFLQVFGKLHADARADAVGIDRVVEHAKPLSRLEIGIGRGHGGRVVEFQRGFVGFDRGAEISPRLQHPGKLREAGGAAFHRARQAIGIERRRGDFGRQPVAFRSVPGLDGHQRRGQPRPQGRIVGRKADGGLERLGGGARVARLEGRIGPLAQLALAHALKARQRHDAAAVAHRLIGRTLRQESEHGRRAGLCCLRRGLDHAAGDGAGEGFQLAVVGLEEAVPGLHVVGEGAAAAILETGGRTLVQAQVLDGLVVEAEIVGVGRLDDAPLVRHGAGGGGKRNEGKAEDENKAGNNAERHGQTPD